MRMSMKNVFLYLLCLLVLPIACSSPKSTVSQRVVNLSNMYNPTTTHFHPAYTIYHSDASTSLLFIKIFPSELLYSGTIEPDKLLGKVSLSYSLMDITDPQKPEMADSGKFALSFARENADKRFQTQLPLKTQAGKRYQLAITAKDLVRKDENLTYLYVDKSLTLSEQNFLVTSAEEKSPFYKPYVVGNSILRISCIAQGFDSVFVFYYGQEMPLPRPSFSLIREKEYLEKPDSVWVLPFSKVVSYQLNYEGVYHFQLDTSLDAGLTLMNYGESYPKVHEVKQLIESLAYLATSTEYDVLKKAINQKLAVDNFWLEKAGNIEKARELIRVYYNRVFWANYYFTSFKPGWKTDRGMIFIIYGPPQSVKVDPLQEKWIYYKNNFSTTVTFTFDHTPTSFSLDNYTLQRSDSYDTYWRNAVDTWRKGKIYLIE
jgi:GWxTD domain-containing protein